MQILSVILVLAGLYLAVVHMPPLPLNHEEIGLGTMHQAHTIIGVVLIVAAAVVFWLGRRRASTAA
jgi:hypothetical protein